LQYLIMPMSAWLLVVSLGLPKLTLTGGNRASITNLVKDFYVLPV